MANAQNYRFKCRNPNCGYECLKRYNIEEYDELQFSKGGIGCFQCGFARMIVMKSNAQADDGFKPGFQRNIRKHCDTYAEYKAHLKKMGLIEIGYEELNFTGEDSETDYWTDDIIKGMFERNMQLSGNEIKALQEGKI